jgi:hypothetical protein
MTRKRRHRLQQKKVAQEKTKPIERLPELVQIPAEAVAQVWPLGARHIEAGLRGAEWFPSAIRDECETGDSQLWFAWAGAVEAAAVTKIIETPTGMVCVVASLGGERMHRWLGLLDQLEAWAKSEGCSRMRFFGRKGWTRKLNDYRVSRLVCDKEL